MPRTQEGFNDYVAAELRAADQRMDELVGKVNAIEQDQAAAKALLKENTEAIAAASDADLYGYDINVGWPGNGV